MRAYASDPAASEGLLSEGMGFERTGRGRMASGAARAAPPSTCTSAAPAEPGLSGAGTVHHVAFATEMDEHEAWREKVSAAGARPTPVIDRFYFRSIYYREPSGVLFELATKGPGFAVDEPAETLGERLALPPNYEQYREELEKKLTPLPNPRARTAASSGG